MGRNKEPVQLIMSKGRSHHLTKEMIRERQEQEVPVVADNIKPPGFLKKKKQKDKFYEIADALCAMGIMSNADCDVLGRYVKCQDDWERYGKLVETMTARLEKAIIDSAECEPEYEKSADERIEKYTWYLKEYENLRSKAFVKCQECAGLLGMTITGRGKIVLPKKDEKQKENKFSQFMRL